MELERVAIKHVKQLHKNGKLAVITSHWNMDIVRIADTIEQYGRDFPRNKVPKCDFKKCACWQQTLNGNVLYYVEQSFCNAQGEVESTRTTVYVQL